MYSMADEIICGLYDPQNLIVEEDVVDEEK